MSILQIGRAFDGIDVDVSSLSSSGDKLSISGDLQLGAVTLANRPGVAMACRDRLNALITNRGEIDVPVVWSEDSSIDGYYRPTGVQVSDTQVALTEGNIGWQVDLERAGGGSLGQYEIFGFHAARTNPHSITNASINAAPYDASTAISDTSLDPWSGFVSTSTAVTTDTAGVVVLSAAGSSFPLALTTTYTVAPSGAYRGACRLTTTYGAAINQLVTSAQCPSDAAGFLLSNGIIRVSKSVTNADALTIGVYDGAWVTLAGGVDWRITNSGTNRWGLDRFQVLANTPERITIRFVSVSSFSFPSNGRYWLDLTVRRGSRFVIGQVGVDAAFGTFALAPSSSVAATALTGGIRATADDANGNRAVWAVAGGTAVTNTLASGTITQNSAATSMPFMVGFEQDGSTSAGLETAQNTLWDYYDIRNETQRVVRR